MREYIDLLEVLRFLLIDESKGGRAQKKSPWSWSWSLFWKVPPISLKNPPWYSKVHLGNEKFWDWSKKLTPIVIGAPGIKITRLKVTPSILKKRTLIFWKWMLLSWKRDQKLKLVNPIRKTMLTKNHQNLTFLYLTPLFILNIKILTFSYTLSKIP